MNRLLVLLALASIALACAAPTPHESASQEAGEARIVIDPAAADSLGKSAMAAWLGYGMQKSLDMAKSAAPTGDDFAIELAARTALVEIWDEMREKESVSDPYLDVLARVHQAGYLDEYVLAYFARPGWTIPGDALGALDPAGFLRFAGVNLVGHESRTVVQVVRPDFPGRPRVPGDDLPDLEELVAGGELCAERPRAARALAAWRRQEQGLDAIALGVSDTVELLRAIDLVRDDPAYRERGVIWVSEAAASLSFLVGFCEMDRRNPAASLPALEDAVRLAPIHPMWRLELVQALIFLNRLDEADREIDTTLSIADPEDSCTLGAAWRRRGYVLIERGELLKAHEAYSRSLDYDPKSEVAASELRVIVSELLKQDGVVPEYTPPPGGIVGVIECAPN